jgi:hypothetical protein
MSKKYRGIRNLKDLIAYNFITEFQINIATKVNPSNDIQLAAMAKNRQIASVTVVFSNLLLRCLGIRTKSEAIKHGRNKY